MKNPLKLLSLPLMLGLLLGLMSCEDKYTETYQVNVPTYLSIEEWRAQDITAAAAKAMSATGKIYIYGDYLFVVSPGAGVHIINNANPSSPQNIAFLPVLGCADVAVMNDKLYVDSYFDLLAFDLSQPSTPTLTCRILDAFEFQNWHVIPGFDQALSIANIDTSRGVIVGWTQQEVSSETNGFQNGQNNNLEAVGFGSGANTATGIGGSMAQFTITGNFLYVLRPASISTFNLASNVCPERTSVVSIGWDAETIFPYNNHLFLGTTSGMMIYHLNNPAEPGFVSAISHLTACDPVVVQGDRAYVTIRTGSTCFGVLNQLLVIDISDYNNPGTIAEYNLTNPHGLGIDGNTLFICDGSAGLKVFDASDDLAILDNQIAQYSDINTYDVIPHNEVLILSASEGIYQYNYANPLAIELLSFMATQ